MTCGNNAMKKLKRGFIMTEFEKLIELEKTHEDVFVTRKSDGEEGVASVNLHNQVAVYIGADDGSDDVVISPEQFNSEYFVK